MSIEEIQVEALNILIGGVRVAQSKGCYSLDEAAKLSDAVNVFINPPTGDEILDINSAECEDEK